MFAESDDDYRPQPQVEYSGGGPGARILTAVGAAGDRPYIDPSTLPDPPWWFVLAKPLLKLHFEKSFCRLPIEVALSTLERAGVPPLYRLALGLHWGFIDSQSEQFSWLDLAEIMREHELLQNPLDTEMARIEARSEFQIWRALSSSQIAQLTREPVGTNDAS